MKGAFSEKNIRLGFIWAVKDMLHIQPCYILFPAYTLARKMTFFSTTSLRFLNYLFLVNEIFSSETNIHSLFFLHINYIM